MVTGYEAVGRIGDALSSGRDGFHASVIVGFGVLAPLRSFSISLMARMNDRVRGLRVGLNLAYCRPVRPYRLPARRGVSANVDCRGFDTYRKRFPYASPVSPIF